MLAFSFDEMLHSGALGLLLKGGFFMWPILLLGVLAAGVIIERWRSLKIIDSDVDDLRDQVVDLLSRQEIEAAKELCDKTGGPIAAVMGNGLRKYFVLRELNYEPVRIEEQVTKSMETYGTHVVAALEKHLPILATVASVAPMLGFLGTVQGMILSFANIVETMGQVNIVEAAASGIQTALLTTCFGLIIGIPAYMSFNYFTSVINQFVLEVESSAAELNEAISIELTLGSNAAQTA
jgi:biopolymer transport protein ExbB